MYDDICAGAWIDCGASDEEIETKVLHHRRVRRARIPEWKVVVSTYCPR